MEEVVFLQFGEGNFLRAFVDYFIQIGNEKGIINASVCVIQPIKNGRLKELKEAGGVYNLLLAGKENGIEKREIKKIDCIKDFIDFGDWNKLSEYAKNPKVKFVVSNTTEAGIILNENDTLEKLDTFPAKVVFLLKERYEAFSGDLTKGLNFLACELIDKNSEKLKEIVIKLSKLWNLEKDFIDWIENANEFANTLVDRIVPGYPTDEADKINAEIGYVDKNLIKGEVFHLWVIQGSQKLEKEFPISKTGLNIIFSQDITPYKDRKVKLLNGMHTSLTPISYLAGINSVGETLKDLELKTFLIKLMDNEFSPTVKLPQKEVKDFANSVIDRFSNPFIYHKLMDISLNSTSKWKARVFPSVLIYFEENKELPKRIIFGLASLFVFFHGIRLTDNSKIELKDDEQYLSLYKDIWAKYDGSSESIKKISSDFLSMSIWEDKFLKIDGFLTFFSKCVESILKNGIKKSIEEIFNK